MSEIWGYARCSTDETRQDIDRQKRELLKMGVPDERHVFFEYASGASNERKELARLFETAKPGDTIAATEVSRLTRSTQHLCIRIGSFTVDCRTEDIDAMTKGMLMMWAVFSEMERDIISERVKSGMRNAAAKGKQIGRPTTTADALPRDFWRTLKLYQQGTITVSDMARMLNCSRTTVYKYMDVAGVRR